MKVQLVYDAPLPPEFFFGRGATIGDICERLRRPQLQSSTVFGGPKMGKTSLLRFLCSARADRHYHGKPLIRVYFDGQVVGSNSTENDFWVGVLKALSEQSPPGPPADFLNGKLAKASTQILSKFDVVDIFDGYGRAGTPVALFVDNFDTPLRNDYFWTGSDFFHNLRLLDEREPRGLGFVMATPRPLRDYWRPGAPVSQFFNTWLDRPLEPLKEQLAAWAERCLDGVTNVDHKALQRLVAALSDGHPFIANFVLELCIERSRTAPQPDAAMVEQRLRATGGPGPMLMRRILAELTPFERDMLRSLANGEPMAPAKIRALQRLAGYGLLPPGTTIPEEGTE